mgnify:FL=1|jgi:hypothetical protein
MSTDFESREQSLYESLLESAKTPKAKACLFNVRKACSSILKVKGNLTYAAVARFIDDVDNLEILQLINGVAGPKQQSISNNKNFKMLINLYIEELDRIKGRPQSSNDVGAKSSEYPTAGLDSKTKLYINMLNQKIQALEKENETLSLSFQDQTKSSPLKLADAVGKSLAGKTTGLLPHIPDVSNEKAVISILKAVASAPIDFPDHFVEKTKNGKSALFLYSPSGDKRVIPSSDWMWLKENFDDR